MMKYYFDNSQKLYYQEKISYSDFLEISLLFNQAKLEQNQKATSYKLYKDAFHQRLKTEMRGNEEFFLPLSILVRLSNY